MSLVLAASAVSATAIHGRAGELSDALALSITSARTIAITSLNVGAIMVPGVFCLTVNLTFCPLSSMPGSMTSWLGLNGLISAGKASSASPLGGTSESAR